MKAYRVQGMAPFGSFNQKFTLDVVAENEDGAKAKIYSTLGSRHRAPRRKIHVDSVSEIDPRTSKEPYVLNHFREHITAQGGPIQPSEEE